MPIVKVGRTVHGDLFTAQARVSVPLEVRPGRQGVPSALVFVYGSYGRANAHGWLGVG